MPFTNPSQGALALSLIACLSSAAAAQAPDPDDTRMLAEPAISAHHVAFVYAEDLWVCGRDGRDVRRLTTHVGAESSPRFSPDGELIAFSGEYDGNRDVFVVPVAGGTPRRLTWHPASDDVQSFTVDGSAVLFTSGRNSHTRRFTQLFEVPVDGGHPTQLPIPNASEATYSPDGKKIAYAPLGEAFRQWKNYRGGRTSRLWLYDRSDHSVEQIPQPEGRCNDIDPMWIGDSVYFLSDRAGEFNLFVYEPTDRSVRQITRYEDFPILNASAGGDAIAFERMGYLFTTSDAGAAPRRLAIGVTADLVETRPRYVDGGDFVRAGEPSPSGARAVLEVRGDIVTVPAEKGPPRNLTQTPGAHERHPTWSPDGRWIAYVSDAGGEYSLHIAPQRGGQARAIQLEGSGFYEALSWSPDSEKIAYLDNGWALSWLDVATGTSHAVSTETIYGRDQTAFAWSPDSRWIAYTRRTPTLFRQVYLHSLDEGTSHPVTDGLSDVGEPVFDRGGKYLYMLASTDAGPVRQWFAMSNADMAMTHSLFLAVLPKGVPSPLRRESDEEEGADRVEKGGPIEAASKVKDKPRATVTVDFDGLDQRIVEIGIDSGYVSNLRPGVDGHVFYLRRDSNRGVGGGSTLYRYSLEDREEKTVADGVRSFSVSADGKKLLVWTGPASASIVDAKPDVDKGKGAISLDAVEVRIDPRAEWRQIFDEAWRINRDYFYDPGMHGSDWAAMREKYAAFLPHLATRSDLNRVIQWMCSELAVGHHRVSGGDRLYSIEAVPVGLLGADYEIQDGRYRIAKVYGGLNWNRGLRSPLTEPGVDVVAGEYLLAVDGADLRTPENLYGRFENKADRIVEITVGPGSDGTGSRTVQVVPVSDESELRNRDWVEGNLRRVDEATGGRVAYVYVPNTSTNGHTYFKRYFFPQAHKQAIIVDERYNGGGQIADYYIDILSRPAMSRWATRYGEDFKGPLMSIQGPKVMLIDETAGSGGDLLPWMFRKAKLGPLIGRRTWGGLVGMLGTPQLIDGGSVTAPNLAFWSEDGFTVENEGVPPDIEIEQLPAAVIAGRDPQLEKAIEVVLQQLEESPPQTPKRPSYPRRARH